MGTRLFPEIPEDLTQLTDEELSDLQTQYREIAQALKADDSDLLVGRDPDKVIEEMTQAAESAELIEVEVAARADAVKAFSAKKAELLSFADEAEETPPEEGDEKDESADKEEALAEEEVEDTVAEVEEPEAVVAAAEPEKPRLRIPGPTPERKPHVSKPEGRGFVASANLQNVQAGTSLDRSDLVEAIKTAHETTIAGSMRQKVLVARAKADYPEDRRLGQPSENQEIIDNILQGANYGHPTNALVAAAAENGSCLCAPVEPYYGQLGVSVADRPVRDSLVAFQATRGGVQYVLPPSLASITTAVGVITEEECEGGGSTAEKTCQTVECKQTQEVDAASIYRCLTFQNLAARAAPEVVAAWTDLAIAAQAAAAEQLFLDAIATASTAVTSTGPNGAINSLMGDIIEAAAGLRSRHRMRRDAPLQVLLPEWVPDLLTLDLIRNGEDNRFDITQGMISALLSKYNVTPTFYLDSETGAGQVFAGQAPGVLAAFPATVVWYIFAAGSFLALDAGRLDLGIVRDSTLNETNNYQIFAETWENVAFVGVESLKVTSTVCPTGESALPSPSDLSCGAWQNFQFVGFGSI